LIEAAYTQGENMGLMVLCEDEAGSYQAIAQTGQSWHEQNLPARMPHEYVRAGTAKLLTLFRPATGELHAKGVVSSANAILHPWLESTLTVLLEQHPVLPVLEKTANRATWVRWQHDLIVKFTLPTALPRLRALLVMDNLAGHKTPSLMLWLVSHGVMPVFTPLGGSWLNMAESIQRIIVRRALEGSELESPEAVIAALEATVRGWNRTPTPFVWGGKRRLRRELARARRLGGSGATVRVTGLKNGAHSK
jgi:DDE superfamily endonuclease